MLEQMPLYRPETWSVSDITRYLKDLIESDHNLADIWVQGEISNLSRPRSGHLYFTIKDSSAALRVVMWRNAASRVTYELKDGDSIEAHGNISIYEVGGQYQLYADFIRPMGEGLLYQEFLCLKNKLEAEGLFDEERKRPIPSRPKLIGIVTSPTGAALRDVLNTVRRRFPLAKVILASSAVQGENAPPEIVKGIEDLNQHTNPDVILVTRGGGSIEDLWAFNDESVARAIAASSAPVISGVGHQTDFTIADFVADLRAPTPTAAAELATPDSTDLKMGIGDLSQHLVRTILDQTNRHRWTLKELSSQLDRYSPLSRIQSNRQRLDEMTHRAIKVMSYWFQIQRTRLISLDQRLTALNPDTILSRGYAVVSQQDGTIVNQVAGAKPGDKLNVRVSDGDFSAEVIDD